MLNPQVHSEVTGTFHDDGLYPAALEKRPQFLLRSCKTSTGWSKRRLEPSEVLSLYEISDSVALGLNPDLKYKVIITQHLTQVKIMLSAAFAVITEFPGGGGDLTPERRVKVRQEEEPEDTLVQDHAGKLGNLGVKGKPFNAQEQEATKDDDAEIPYHLRISRLTRLWDSQLLPPSIEKPAEVLIQHRALRFWKIKVRRNLFDWFSNEYHFRVKHQKVAVWNGTKYVWNENHKAQYMHYWSSMWGHIENDQSKSLLAAADCIERATNFLVELGGWIQTFILEMEC
jgi:hypothetical protein